MNVTELRQDPQHQALQQELNTLSTVAIVNLLRNTFTTDHQRQRFIEALEKSFAAKPAEDQG